MNFQRFLKPRKSNVNPTSPLGLRLWVFLGAALLNLFVYLVLLIFLSPMTFMLVTSLKPDNQFFDTQAPILPANSVSMVYAGKTIYVYTVPTDQGNKQWALYKPGRTESQFIDPANPAAGPITWKGQWRSLKPIYTSAFNWGTYVHQWQWGRFPLLVRNTLFLAFVTIIGTLFSSICVAYGFSRFPIPGGKWLFFLLIGTIMIPDKITLIPTYVLYLKLGWVGSFLPLIIPHLFGNAIFIFLLRQNFRSVPKDLDEAAMLDGADPLRILFSVILPQTYPAVITVALLQFFYIWNESRNASLYLSTRNDLYTITFGIANNNTGFPIPNLLQASAVMVMVVPVIVLFLSNRVFMNRVLVTGMEK
jgi:multiple sugar transport system permease protein